MYLDYWQLDSKPFEPVAERSVFYPCEAHQGALLKLRYAIENKRSAVLLAGPVGIGKSLLIDILQQDLPEQFQPFAHLVFPQMSSRELLAYLADRLGAPPAASPRHTVDESVLRLEKLLTENAAQGRHAVVAIDEAHSLEDGDLLETLRLLLNFSREGQPLLTLVLVGQPGLLTSVARFPGLDQRLGVKSLLRPLSTDETASYLQHRLTAAGAIRDLFSNDAVEAVHYLSHGLPGQINRLCDLALVVGFAEGVPQLEAAHIEAVSQELIVVVPE